MIESDDLAIVSDGIMFYNTSIDGVGVRAGLGSGKDGGISVSEVLSLLKPTIEAYLQVKHFHFGSDAEQALLIDTRDLLTH